MTKEKRPEALEGRTEKRITGCGALYVTVNFYKQKPFEVFLKMGKAGGCASAQCEGIGRLVSYALRSGGDHLEIARELQGIRCHQPNEEMLSCSDAVADVLSGIVREEIIPARTEASELSLSRV